MKYDQSSDLLQLTVSRLCELHGVKPQWFRPLPSDPCKGFIFPLNFYRLMDLFLKESKHDLGSSKSIPATYCIY